MKNKNITSTIIYFHKISTVSPHIFLQMNSMHFSDWTQQLLRGRCWQLNTLEWGNCGDLRRKQILFRDTRTYYVWLKHTVKKTSFGFLFWEGMHRHAAIIMTLLCANITYNTKNCYKPRTLEQGTFQDYIKGFTDPGPEPLELIQDIFDRKSNSRMLKTVINVMAYIPNKRETTIDKLFETMQTQSKHVSKNKLSSAARTLSTLLSDWLRQCSPQFSTSVPVQK